MSTRSKGGLSLLPPRSDGQPGAPRGDDLLLSSVYAEKKESFVHRYGKRIAGSIACAFVVSVIMNLKYVHFVVLWACQIVILIFGRPPGYDRVPEIKDKAAHAVEKVKDAAHAHASDGPVPKAAGPVREALAVGKSVHAAAAKVEAVKDEAKKGAAKVAEAGHEVAGAIKGMGSHAKESIGEMAAHRAEAQRARQEAQEKAMHDQLIVRARAVGVTVDASWSLARLAAEVGQAEDVAWRKRYNAQCPNPRCHKPLRLNPSTPAWKTGNCIYCGGRFYLRAAINLGPPPARRGR